MVGENGEIETTSVDWNDDFSDSDAIFSQQQMPAKSLFETLLATSCTAVDQTQTKNATKSK